jgi:hypothetical protein
VVVPDSESTRRHFERLNEVAGVTGKHYKIEEATEAEIAEFNPSQSASAPVGGGVSVQIDELRANQKEIDGLKAKLEELTSPAAKAPAANTSPATTTAKAATKNDK